MAEVIINSPSNIQEALSINNGSPESEVQLMFTGDTVGKPKKDNQSKNDEVDIWDPKFDNGIHPNFER